MLSQLIPLLGALPQPLRSPILPRSSHSSSPFSFFTFIFLPFHLFPSLTFISWIQGWKMNGTSSNHVTQFVLFQLQILRHHSVYFTWKPINKICFIGQIFSSVPSNSSPTSSSLSSVRASFNWPHVDKPVSVLTDVKSYLLHKASLTISFSATYSAVFVAFLLPYS